MAPHPFVGNLLRFSRTLRAAGLPLTSGQSLELARALELVDVGDRDQVFHAARSLLVHRREDLALFEILFDRFWRAGDPDEAAGGASPRAQDGPERPTRERLDGLRLRSAPSGDARDEVEAWDRSNTVSDREVLRHKDFAEMSAAELAELRRLILELRWPASLRRTRRWSSDPRGERLHLRKIVREAARTGGVPLRLARQRRKLERRPIVLIADVSGSMEKYSRIALQFFYAAFHGLGKGEVEAFAFGTRLTRLTPFLRQRNVDRALEAASAEILDWSGGTRIGESLGSYNRQWGRRLSRRGAVILVISDGWERGDVTRLEREMRHLHGRCHRLVWLNPHAGRAGYEPRVQGMSAALPWVDDFLPIHNLDSLRSLARRLGELPERKTGLRIDPAESFPVPAR